MLAALSFAACESGALRMPGPGRMPWAPSSLLEIETRAEAAADAALGGDAERASSEARRAVLLWPSVRRAASERAVDPALLRRIDGAVADLQKAAAPLPRSGGASASAQEGSPTSKAGRSAGARAAAPAAPAAVAAAAAPGPSEVPPGTALLTLAETANGLAGYAAGLMNLFQMTVPAALPTLDFQARAALIEGRLGEWKAAEAYVAALDGTMLAFFPTARAKAPDDLPELERRLADLRGDVEAKDAAALEADARRFIAAVETLRRGYVKGK